MNAIIREKQLLQSPFPSFGMSPSDPPITVSQRWDEPIRPSDYRFPALGRAHPTLRLPFPSFGTSPSDPPITVSQLWDGLIRPSDHRFPALGRAHPTLQSSFPSVGTSPQPWFDGISKIHRGSYPMYTLRAARWLATSRMRSLGLFSYPLFYW